MRLMLQVIFFAIFFGIVLLMIPATTAAPVIALMNGLNEVFMKMVDVVMKAAPWFVFALMAGVVSRIAGDDPAAVVELFKSLAGYSITVVLGLALGGLRGLSNGDDHCSCVATCSESS